MPHPLQPSGLCTRGIPSHCSPPVCHSVAPPHCRVCVRHSRAGRLRALNAVSPHSHVVTSPRRHSSRSRPTSPTASPWRAVGLWVIAVGVDQHPKLHLHRVPKRYRRWLCVAQYRRPTAPSWAAQWACGSSQKESTNIPNCYPQVTRAVALVVLYASTAGLKHLSIKTVTAGLVKLKLLYWERVKKGEDHVPHVVFSDHTLLTHVSFVHQFVSASGAAGSRQGLPATRVDSKRTRVS